jgi:hypothetical protein
VRLILSPSLVPKLRTRGAVPPVDVFMARCLIFALLYAALSFRRSLKRVGCVALSWIQTGAPAAGEVVEAAEEFVASSELLEEGM